MAKAKEEITMVMPVSGKAPDLENMTPEKAVAEYKVPKSLFDVINGAIPDFIKDGIKKFVMGVPTLDKESGIMKMELTINDDSGKPNILVKLKVDMTGKGEHSIKVSTDAGESWRKLTYTESTGNTVKAEEA